MVYANDREELVERQETQEACTKLSIQYTNANTPTPWRRTTGIGVPAGSFNGREHRYGVFALERYVAFLLCIYLVWTLTIC